jgi:hypothetical protein
MDHFYRTIRFFSHVKARIQETVKNIDLRIGSDDESGLTKALDNVFPEATRLLCTKHMKDNVSEYLKNSLGSIDKQRSDIISKLFGSNGLVAAEDSFEFESKSENLISENPEFARYFDSRLKNRLLEHVNKPKKQLQHERLWTNNNCESMNHVFKRAVDWKPQPLPELVRSLNDVVRIHFVDLRRAIYGTDNYQLFGRYKRHSVSQQCWFSKTEEQKESLYKKLSEQSEFISASSKEFQIPKPQKLPRKPNQRKRPRTCRTQPKY